jgi:hypothetical protein
MTAKARAAPLPQTVLAEKWVVLYLRGKTGNSETSLFGVLALSFFI